MRRDADTEPVAAHQGGEDHSFAALYEAYRRPLYRYCLSFARETELAEDVTQEAFIRLHRDLGTLRHGNSVRCWLFTVARNDMLGAIRKRKFQVPMEDHDAADEDTPATIVEREESADLVRRMMNELVEEYREVLVLREFDEFSYAEIAAITSSSMAAIKSRLFHARRALAERLRPWFEERSAR